MRRFIVALMLVFLPFQFAWSAAASYCGHEKASAAIAKHFGHHSHEHKEAPGADDHKAKRTGLAGAADSDCPTCHLSAPSLATTMVAMPQRLVHAQAPDYHSAQHASVVSDAPDRPNWARLA